MPKTVTEYDVEQLRPSLTRLAAAPERATPARIWRALTTEERTRATLAMLTDIDDDDREHFIDKTAKQHHFRYQTMASWPPERVARAVARRDPADHTFAVSLLRSMHLEHRSKLLAGFLDELGIEHRNGQIVPDVSTIDVTRQAVMQAADHVAPLYAIDEVVTYFLTLIALRYPLADGLDEWLRILVGESAVEAGTDDDAEDAEEVESLAAEPADVEDTDEFTTLDQQLVRSIVDVAQGIEGALSVDELDDLLKEVLELNSTRHRSYFHAGLRDAVLGDGPRDELPASNERRWRWYWAGFVQGRAREERWDEIVVLFDNESTVRELGDTSRDPAAAAVSAAPQIVRALCRHDRAGEAAKFLDAETVIETPGLFTLLREEAEPLLRKDRAAEARTIYDLLTKVVRRLEQSGLDTARRTFLEVRRRRAHCYRQLGELNVARRLLTELLDEESDPEIRSMVLADLGLIDGGFRRLADLGLPMEEEKLETFVAALTRGVPRFEAAMELDVRYSAHARYALGVLAFVEKQYDDAVDHLEVALSVFESEPARYSPGEVLDYARMYLGLALCLALHPGRLQRAAELIREAIRGGAELPHYLITNTLTAMSLGSLPMARDIAEVILEEVGPEVLDLLAASEACRDSPAIAQALYARGSDPERGEVARAQDYHQALPILLGQGRLDEAGTALDFLETAALRGVSRDRFVEVLEDPDRYSPAWDVDDADASRVRCLEAAGEYTAAADALAKTFHQILSQRDADGLVDAEAILDRIREYGLPREYRDSLLEPLTARLESMRRTAVDDDAEHTGAEPARKRSPVRILFVGGDERQESYNAAIVDQLRTDHPHITVEFIHPGWSSNWGMTLEEAQRRLATKDGVVISRFIRTEFGRRLRKSLEVPWRGCYGAGKRAMIASIVRVGEAAERAVAERVSGGA